MNFRNIFLFNGFTPNPSSVMVKLPLNVMKSRGGCRGLLLQPMQHPEMAHINFETSVFVSKKTVNKILKLDQK